VRAVRLLELQNERDSVAACTAAGRAVADENLRGWAALLPLEATSLLEGLKQSGVPVLRGSIAALALGSLSQLWSAGRSLEAALTKHQALARELRERAANVEAPAAASAWKLPRSALPIGRVLVMGIVNATPDSFSDGGTYDPVKHAMQLIDEGADLLDVGGESTQPDAEPVDARTELARVAPVLRACNSKNIPLSIDTTKAEVARAAIDLGAEIVNDVSGFTRDARMGEAARGAAVLLMHSRGTPREMGQRAVYQDLQGELLDELSQALGRARAAGIPDERIALDPGLGFAKIGAQNFTVLRKLRELTQLGRPLAIGASRKSFIGAATGRKAPERLFGSVAAAVAAALDGAAIVRAHDVQATREALLVADAIRTASS
jgi:dihydropteroate synthase